LAETKHIQNSFETVLFKFHFVVRTALQICKQLTGYYKLIFSAFLASPGSNARALQKPIIALVILLSSQSIKSIKQNYFIVRQKVDQRAGQLSLPRVGITKTEKME